MRVGELYVSDSGDKILVKEIEEVFFPHADTTKMARAKIVVEWQDPKI